jgi:L-ascorbate 6-phosphate lactonase
MYTPLDLHTYKNHTPPDSLIDVYWLGGSGYIIKFDDKITLCIDPYLSDSVERLHGFERLSPAPISADQLTCDILLISHEHGDHMDVDSIDTIYAGNPEMKVFAPASCDEFLREHCPGYTLVKAGDRERVSDITVTALKADHGELSPDALGFMLTYKDRKIFFTGDTGFNLEVLKPAIAATPEIIIPCINGAYGNLDEEQSAQLAGLCHSKIAIPTHYGLFKEHGGDVERFITNLNEISPQTRVLRLSPATGARIRIERLVNQT